MSITGEPNGRPMKVGVALLDLIAGLECAVGALAALVGRGRTTRVQVNLVEAGVTSLINVLGNFLASGEEPGRHGNAHPNIAPYESFEASDGHLVIAVGNDAQFVRLLRVLDLDDADGRYVTNAMRLGRQSELSAWIGSAVSRRGRDELVAALAEADVPAGPVNTVSEALAAMGEGWTATLDGITLAPSPIRVGGVAPAPRRPPATRRANGARRGGAIRRIGAAPISHRSTATSARSCWTSTQMRAELHWSGCWAPPICSSTTIGRRRQPGWDWKPMDWPTDIPTSWSPRWADSPEPMPSVPPTTCWRRRSPASCRSPASRMADQ
jgi:hypothetical protein